jgi:hypothetical protein
MEIIMTEPPSTPPRRTGELSLLTPPPTIAAEKRRCFIDHDKEGETTPKRLATSKEIEWSIVGEGDGTLRKDSDTSTIEVGQVENRVSSSEDELPELPLISPTSIVNDTSKDRKKSASVPIYDFDASLLPESITFMKLPQKIRMKIYALLLTIPAIICVRPNRTPYEHFPVAFSNVADIKCLPGMAMALTQISSNGFKSRFYRFPYVNTAILRTNSKIHSEAKKILYGSNTYDFLNLTKETAPPADFRIPIFAAGCARMLRSVCIRANSVYAFRWMVTAGYQEIKKFYRSLEVLHLVLEIDNIRKGYGKKLVRQPKENWVLYVKRVVAFIAVELFDCVGIARKIPVWISLSAVFEDERYEITFNLNRDVIRDEADKNTSTEIVELADEQFKKEDLKRAVSEAFELFKRGRR